MEETAQNKEITFWRRWYLSNMTSLQKNSHLIDNIYFYELFMCLPSEVFIRKSFDVNFYDCKKIAEEMIKEERDAKTTEQKTDCKEDC